MKFKDVIPHEGDVKVHIDFEKLQGGRKIYTLLEDAKASYERARDVEVGSVNMNRFLVRIIMDHYKQARRASLAAQAEQAAKDSAIPFQELANDADAIPVENI